PSYSFPKMHVGNITPAPTVPQKRYAGYDERNARGDGRLQDLRQASADQRQPAGAPDLRRLQGHQKARAQPQNRRAPQGRTPRRQSKNGSAAMRAVRQAHRGSQSPRHESRAAMGAQV